MTSGPLKFVDGIYLDEWTELAKAASPEARVVALLLAECWSIEGALKEITTAELSGGQDPRLLREMRYYGVSPRRLEVGLDDLFEMGVLGDRPITHASLWMPFLPDRELDRDEVREARRNETRVRL